jgi:hypothetical protein
LLVHELLQLRNLNGEKLLLLLHLLHHLVRGHRIRHLGKAPLQKQPAQARLVEDLQDTEYDGWDTGNSSGDDATNDATDTGEFFPGGRVGGWRRRQLGQRRSRRGLLRWRWPAK